MMSTTNLAGVWVGLLGVRHFGDRLLRRSYGYFYARFPMDFLEIYLNVAFTTEVIFRFDFRWHIVLIPILSI